VGHLSLSPLLLASRVVTATLLVAPHALADPEESDPRCRGVHSLASPLPDPCLAVIDTDRPHQTDTPHVVPAGHAQIESALAAAQLGGRVGAPSGDRSAHVLLFDDAYKFGVVSGVDLQLIMQHADYVPDARHFVAPGPLTVRAKLSVIEEKGWMPATTLVPWVFLPVGSSQALRGGPLVFWGWELPGRFELEMNAGLLLGTRPKPAVAAVLASALTYTIAGELRVFVDAYATGWDIALGTGALWAIARDVQIDLGSYIGLNGDEPVATPFVGLSVRR
jgi:hypothetical protein